MTPSVPLLRHEDHPPDRATLRRWGIVDRRELNKLVGVSEICLRTYWSQEQARRVIARGQIPCKRYVGQPLRYRLGDICLWVDTLWERYGGPGEWLIAPRARPFGYHTPWRKGRKPKPIRVPKKIGRPFGSKSTVPRSRERGPDKKPRKMRWTLGSPEALLAAVRASSVLTVARETGRNKRTVFWQVALAKEREKAGNDNRYDHEHTQTDTAQ